MSAAGVDHDDLVEHLFARGVSEEIISPLRDRLEVIEAQLDGSIDPEDDEDGIEDPEAAVDAAAVTLEICERVGWDGNAEDTGGEQR
jgi:hypothetical protein